MNITIISRISRFFLLLGIIASFGMPSLSAMNRQIFLSSKKSVSDMHKTPEEVMRQKELRQQELLESKNEVEQAVLFRLQELGKWREEGVLSLEGAEELKELMKSLWILILEAHEKIDELKKQQFLVLNIVQDYIFDCVRKEYENVAVDQVRLEALLKDLFKKEITPISWQILQEELSNAFGPQWLEELYNRLSEESQEYQQLQEEILDLHKRENEYLPLAIALDDEMAIFC